MRTQLVATAVAVAALVIGVAAASAAESGVASAGGAHASVIGGSVARIEDYPWLAYFEGNLDGGGFPFSCTGTVIAPRVVLTAGHCIEDLEAEVIDKPGGYLVATGVADRLRIPAAHRSRVSRALLYPGFKLPYIQGDAGLLILKRPTAAPAIPLAGEGDTGLLAAGTRIEIAGWGLSRSDREEAPALLQRGSLLVQDAARCRRGNTELHAHFSPDLELCALDAPGFRVSGCFGDSGGPAIARRPDGTPVQIGIVSSGGFECETRQPNLYTRVDRVSKWAGEWIAAVETGTPAPSVPPLPAATMNGLEAQLLTTRALAEDFSPTRRGEFEESVDTSCARLDRSRFRCHVHWVHGDGRYVGTMIVFYTPHRGPLTFDDGYRIRRFSESCLRRHPSPGCLTQTRVRKPGRPRRA